VRRQSAAATALVNSGDDQRPSRAAQSGIALRLPPHSKFSHRAFSLIEIMMVVTLLTLIMVALMSVFSSTQTAFRASITQTDVLEGGRATMDMITSDLRQMAPSGGYQAELYDQGAFVAYPQTLVPPILPSEQFYPTNPINFWLSPPVPTIIQPLLGANDPLTMRTNQLQSIFILTYQNQLWRGIGYFVDTNSTAYIDPLYRYDSNIEIAQDSLPARPSPQQIFTNFAAVASSANLDNTTNATHLLDGVVHFNARAYDVNGAWMTNNFAYFTNYVVTNATFYYPVGGEVSLYMCSNTLPAAVEVQMGVVEDRVLQHVFALPAPTSSGVRSNYLAQQVGKVHLFRQRVTIPNVDFTAYQQP
jgi:type II secretory pathway pseudopilin PulG